MTLRTTLRLLAGLSAVAAAVMSIRTTGATSVLAPFAIGAASAIAVAGLIEFGPIFARHIRPHRDKRVFLSYSERLTTEAYKLATELEADGARVWLNELSPIDNEQQPEVSQPSAAWAGGRSRLWRRLLHRMTASLPESSDEYKRVLQSGAEPDALRGSEVFAILTDAPTTEVQDQVKLARRVGSRVVELQVAGAAPPGPIQTDQADHTVTFRPADTLSVGEAAREVLADDYAQPDRRRA
jgi:hypothetical protein